MSEQRMVRFGIAALVLVLLLGAGANAIQQSAWSQGYMMGLIAGNGDGNTLSQYVLYSNGRLPGFGGVIGGFFKIGLMLFGLMLLAKFVFGMSYMRRWQMAAGPGGEWHSHHPGRPWHRQTEDRDNKQQTQAEASPAVRSDSAAEEAGRSEKPDSA